MFPICYWSAPMNKLKAHLMIFPIFSLCFDFGFGYFFSAIFTEYRFCFCLSDSARCVLMFHCWFLFWVSVFNYEIQDLTSQFLVYGIRFLLLLILSSFYAILNGLVDCDPNILFRSSALSHCCYLLYLSRPQMANLPILSFTTAFYFHIISANELSV